MKLSFFIIIILGRMYETLSLRFYEKCAYGNAWKLCPFEIYMYECMKFNFKETQIYECLTV